MIILNRHKDNLYLGAGVLPAYVHIRDDKNFLVPKSVKWTVGGVFKAGIIKNLCYGIFLDFFVDFMYLKVNFSDTQGRVVFRDEGDLSGLSAGGALGYRF